MVQKTYLPPGIKLDFVVSPCLTYADVSTLITANHNAGVTPLLPAATDRNVIVIANPSATDAAIGIVQPSGLLKQLPLKSGDVIVFGQGIPVPANDIMVFGTVGADVTVWIA